MSKKITNDQFLKKLSLINKNITPLEKYKGRHEKILVKDNLGIKYFTSPAALYSAFPGIIISTDKNKAFEIKSRLIHFYKYDYSLVNFVNKKTKVKIICPIHGVFNQMPGAHLDGKGCKKCSLDKLKEIVRSSKAEFIDKSIKVHGYRYDYSKVKYVKAIEKVIIICSEHGDFLQTPSDHLNSHGCSKCTAERGLSFGFRRSNFIKIANINKKSYVYIIRCYNNSENFIKIGITTKNLQERFSSKGKMPYSYEVIKEIKGSPDFVFDKEVELHRKFKQYKYKPLISFGGETECFKVEVLNYLSIPPKDLDI